MTENKENTWELGVKKIFRFPDDKTLSCMIQLFAYAVFLALLLWILPRMSMISQIGTEDIYWERARFFLGYTDESLYDGNSLCSLGYSLILMPICALTGSSRAAYSVALILNMLFVAGAYRVAVAASKKVFPEEKESILSAACFLAVFCPVFTYARSCMGPDMAVLLLTWCSIYLLAVLWESYRRRTLILLSTCLIAIGFLQISALGMIAGVLIVMAFYLRKRRISETAFLTFLLTVFIGIAVGNITERVFLGRYSANMNLSASRTSLEVLFASIGSVRTADYFVILFSALMGKFCTVMFSTFLLICPGLWSGFQSFFTYTKRQRTHFFSTQDKKVIGNLETAQISEEKKDLQYCVVGLLLAQFVFICLYDCSQEAGVRVLSVSGLYMVISPMILMGIAAFRERKSWKKELQWSLLFLALCAVVSANVLNSAGVSSLSNEYGGFLMIFRTSNGTSFSPANTVYMAVGMTGALSILFFALQCGNVLRGKYKKILPYAGFLMLTCLFAIMNIKVVNWSVRKDSLAFADQIEDIVELLSDSDAVTECQYINDNTKSDLLPVLQFLLSDINISMQADSMTVLTETFVADNDGNGITYVKESYSGLDLETDSQVILTSISGSDDTEDYERYEEKLDGWRVLYLTDSFRLWAKTGSAVENEIEESMESRGISVESSDTAEEDTTATDDGAKLYSYGEDADLENFVEIISCLGSGIRIYVVQDLAELGEGNGSYTYIQEVFQEYPVSVISYYTAMDMSDDVVLLTCGLNLNCLELLEYYSILGHAGQYTLWVKSGGEYLAALAEYGYGSLSSGTKLSVASVEAMTGLDADADEVLGLPDAEYRIYLKLPAENLESGSTVRVSLWKEKSEDEIEENINELIMNGYTEEEARERVNTSSAFATESFSVPSTIQNGSFLVSMTGRYVSLTDRLFCTAMAPPGVNVEAEILWVEIVE